MRVMMMLKARPDTEAGFPTSGEQVKVIREKIAGMGRLMEDMAAAGVLVAGDGLQPSAKGKRVRFANGARTITDGPFAETKELVAGFCIIEVKDWNEALAWTARFGAVEGDCDTELRLLYEPTDFPPELFAPEDAAREIELREELKKKAARS